MQIILREKKDNDDYQYLGVELNQEGDMVFIGQDLGKFVKEYYGCIEYEWIWTIKANDILQLKQALGTKGDILNTIKSEFSGNKSYGLIDFLKKNEIPYEEWHRIGD